MILCCFLVTVAQKSKPLPKYYHVFLTLRFTSIRRGLLTSSASNKVDKIDSFLKANSVFSSIKSIEGLIFRIITVWQIKEAKTRAFKRMMRSYPVLEVETQLMKIRLCKLCRQGSLLQRKTLGTQLLYFNWLRFIHVVATSPIKAQLTLLLRIQRSRV